MVVPPAPGGACPPTLVDRRVNSLAGRRLIATIRSIMTTEPALEILVVCTGNVCRSPMAEALLGHRLAERGAAATVRSAGLLASGQPVTEEVIELMRDRQLDVADHLSRMIEADMIATADLVLGMTREHVRETTLLVPGSFVRTFTLKELVRRGEQVGPRPAGMGLGEWLELAGEGRSPGLLLGQSDEDDITDPMGRRFKVYKQVATEIDDLTERLASLLFPERPASVPPSSPSGSAPATAPSAALDWE
jgi:protein-tyrosine phosphatase